MKFVFDLDFPFIVNTNPEVIKEGKRDYKGPVVDEAPWRVKYKCRAAALFSLVTSLRVPRGEAKLKIESELLLIQ